MLEDQPVCENSTAKPTQEPVSYVNPKAEHATTKPTQNGYLDPNHVKSGETTLPSRKPFGVTKALFYHTQTNVKVVILPFSMFALFFFSDLTCGCRPKAPVILK